MSADFEKFSSSAELSIMLELAKLDLKKRTTTAEMVFACCRWFPKRQALEMLIDFGIKSDSEDVTKAVFDYHDHEDYNCMISLFTMATKYRNKTKKYPTGPMLHEIEECCFYLIELANMSGVDLKKYLNHTTKHGITLFDQAAAYSKRLTLYLLKENAKINSINSYFMTPSFRVRQSTDFLK